MKYFLLNTIYYFIDKMKKFILIFICNILETKSEVL